MLTVVVSRPHPVRLVNTLLVIDHMPNDWTNTRAPGVIAPSNIAVALALISGSAERNPLSPSLLLPSPRDPNSLLARAARALFHLMQG